jgi:hypothetical protein
MLDHNDLLPEEQTYPHVVRELQMAYQMKPAEKQVLARVHERLAQSSHALPRLEPVERADSIPLSTVLVCKGRRCAYRRSMVNLVS